MNLTLPYPPSNNRYYRHAKGRSTPYLSSEGSEYRLHVLSKRPRTGWPMLGRLAVVIESNPKVGKGQDLDNMPKAILDSLQHAKIIKNDSQIDDLRIIRRPKVKKGEKPFVLVTIEEIG